MSEEKKISWIKRRRPKSLVKIGASYFIEKRELKSLMNTYFTKQITLRKKRAALARKNFTKVETKLEKKSAVFKEKT